MKRLLLSLLLILGTIPWVATWELPSVGPREITRTANYSVYDLGGGRFEYRTGPRLNLHHPAWNPWLLLATTTQYPVGASADDGGVIGYGTPPAYFSSDTSAASNDVWDNGNHWCLVLFRFDTSGLTSDATISAATMNIYLSTAIYNADSKSIRAEYYASSNWPIGSDDWQGTPVAASAVGTIAIAALGHDQYNAFILLSPNTGISKTGYTGFRWSLSSNSAPTGDNSVNMNTVDYGSPRIPYLSITYTVGGAGAAKRRITR